MGIFDKFKNETKKIKIDGEEVTIRRLTNKEANEVQEILLSDASSKEIENGEVKVSVGKLREVQLLAVSYALVEPKMSRDDLESLPEGSFDLISKIYEAVQNWDKPKK